MLAPNSKKYTIIPLGISIIGFIISYYYHQLIFLFIFTVTTFISLFFIWFFRDPKREIEADDNVILAPADGTIIYINQENNTTKIAIRMSPFNVHINRAPIRGIITKIEHTPGKHHSVYFANAEEKNERVLVTIENEFVYCEVMQITGQFAFRIDNWIQINDKLTQGMKYGMIRFGSQTNIAIIPKSKDKSLNITVKVGNHVHAGKTILARFTE